MRPMLLSVSESAGCTAADSAFFPPFAEASGGRSGSGGTGSESRGGFFFGGSFLGIAGEWKCQPRQLLTEAGSRRSYRNSSEIQERHAILASQISCYLSFPPPSALRPFDRAQGRLYSGPFAHHRFQKSLCYQSFQRLSAISAISLYEL